MISRQFLLPSMQHTSDAELYRVQGVSIITTSKPVVMIFLACSHIPLHETQYIALLFSPNYKGIFETTN